MKADFVYEPRSRSAFDEARRIRVRNRISGKETGYFDGIFGEYIESGVTIQFTYSTIGRLSRYTNRKGIPGFRHIPVAYLILREEIAGQFSQLPLINTIKSKKLESTLLEIIENIASGLRICVKGEYIQDISVEAEIDDFDIDEFQVIIYDTMPSEGQMESIKKAFRHGRAEGIFSEDATFLE